MHRDKIAPIFALLINKYAIMPNTKYIPSKTGFSCPNCGAICSDESFLRKTETEFCPCPDPHYSWTEFHKCQSCETLYTIENGT